MIDNNEQLKIQEFATEIIHNEVARLMDTYVGDRDTHAQLLVTYTSPETKGVPTGLHTSMRNFSYDMIVDLLGYLTILHNIHPVDLFSSMAHWSKTMELRQSVQERVN